MARRRRRQLGLDQRVHEPRRVRAQLIQQRLARPARRLRSRRSRRPSARRGPGSAIARSSVEPGTAPRAPGRASRPARSARGARRPRLARGQRFEPRVEPLARRSSAPACSSRTGPGSPPAAASPALTARSARAATRAQLPGGRRSGGPSCVGPRRRPRRPGAASSWSSGSALTGLALRARA